ncbi:hypothetical protein [Lysobacter sp. FW306-1B-D06B]|uniref:hypothetical protein n=1 Tax=Lysobacter sp. FW306-1B-D06B TaxID=3140250 RepID=UPI00314062A0
MKTMRRLPIVIALAFGLAPVAFAQQANTLQPPRVAPISPATPPSLPVGVDTSRDNASLNRLNRQLDVSSRRVQADTLRNQVDRQDRLMDADRARTDARRAAVSPEESARLRQEFEARVANHEAWRAGKEQQVQRLEVEGIPPPPPPNEVKAPAIQPGR